MVVIIQKPQSFGIQVQPVKILVRSPAFHGTAQNPDAVFQVPHLLLFLRRPLFVDGVPLHQIVLEALRGPLAELGAALRFYAVADGDDDVQVVMRYLIRFPVCSWLVFTPLLIWSAGFLILRSAKAFCAFRSVSFCHG
jgi:hypothetical protein